MIRSAAIVILFACVSLVSAQERVAEVLSDPRVDLRRAADRAQVVTRIQAIENRVAARARLKAAELRLQMRIENPDGNVMEIVDFKGDKPVYASTRNVNAAISTGANLVQASPYSLDGTGLMVGIWDAGSVRVTHQEFSNGTRVTAVDGSAADDHATHVGGTLAAQGTRASAKGMAPNALIRSYNWGSYISEMTAAAATLPSQLDTKIYISNHSWGYDEGWRNNVWGGDGFDQNATEFEFGQYETVARDLDSNLHSTPYHLIFWAVGNDGHNTPSTGQMVTIGGVSVAYNPASHPPGDGVYRNGFDTITAHGLAKNLVSVASVNDAVKNGMRDPSMAGLDGLSSSGPTDDGRIKPDLVANGVSLSSSEAANDSDYGTLSGTSMASPNAAGTALLLVDQYKRLFNSAMRASTLKGLLLHTATDLGNPGPDYKHGWGLIDIKKAVDLVRDHHANPTKNRLTENELTPAVTTRTVTFLWDGGSPLSATLCWSDPAGVANTANDSRTPILVNNLNLKLIAPNGNEYYPYVMPFVGTWTVASMSENASYGVNNTDNVETVNIPNPGQFGTWTAEVSYSGVLSGSSQPYGLLVSGVANQSNLVQILSPTGGETFFRGYNTNITWTSNVVGNVDIMLLKGGSFDSMITSGTPNDGVFSWTVPPSLVLGTDYTIWVRNVPTSTLISTSGNITIAQSPWADALDNTSLVWLGGGTAPWFSQTTITNDGFDALRSSVIPNSGSSRLSTTLVGPGTLTYRLRVSSEFNYDFFYFRLNGNTAGGRVSGTYPWTLRSVSIPAGKHTVEWSYEKDGADIDPVGEDAAFLDQVTYTSAARPAIMVERVADIALKDGNSIHHLGSMSLSNSSAPMTFTIRNTGNANLSSLALSKTGNAQADYTLGSLGSTTLAPNASTTFTVTFSPSITGPRAVRLAIASNDSLLGAFDIDLIGTGVSSGLAVSPAASFNSAGSLGGAFAPASITYTLNNVTSSAFNWTASKTAAWVTLSASSGTLAAGASTTVTATINADANTLNIGGFSDTVTFTNTTNGSGNTTRGVSLTVNPVAATISLSNLLQIFNGSPKPITVTTTPSGLANTVTYAGSATVPTNAGTYAVVATITDPGYTGTASGSLTISKAAQTINFAALNPVLDSAAPFALAVTTSSGLAVSYNNSNPLVATISGNTITVVGLGTTTLTASQTGNANYNAATSVPQILTVVRANPLAVPGVSYKVLIGQSLSLNGSTSQPSNGETISTYEWDLNNDSTFGDATGTTPSAISFATLTSTWGMVQGLNTIRLRVTDSASRTSIVSTTVELVTSLTWDANGTTAGQTNGAGAWLDANRWWDGTANQTWAAGSSAIFGGPNTAGGAVTLGNPTTVNAITFNPFTGTYTLGTASQAITLSGGITKNTSAGLVTIISPLTLGSAQTWTNNSSTNLNVQAATTLNGVLTVDGTGITSFDHASAVISSAGGIIKNGTGHLVLSGGASPLHTFTGDITVTGGSIAFQTSAFLGGRNVRLTNGYLSGRFGSGFTWIGGLGTGANQIQITGGTSGLSGEGDTGSAFQIGSALSTLIWGAQGEGSATGFFNPAVLLANGDARMNPSGKGSLNNGMDLNAITRTITSLQTTDSSATSGFTIHGVISNSSGTAGIIKNGVGQLILPATNTYNGTTIINAGSIMISNANSLGSSAGNTVISSGARVFAGSGMANKTTPEPFSIAGNGVAAANGAIHIGGNASGIGFSGAITLSANARIQADGSTGSTFSGGIDLGSNTLTYNVGPSGNSTVQTLGISGVGGSLVKTDLGTLTLSASGTYTGLTTVSTGLLVVTQANALGGTTTGTLATTGGLALASGVTTNSGESITISSGAADFLGALRAGTGGGTWAGTVNLDASARVGAAANQILTITGSIVNGAGDTLAVSGESGTGVVVLNPTTSNSFTGNANLIRGILRLGKSDALPTGTILDVDSTSGTADAVTFDMAGFNQTVTALQDSATTNINGKISNSAVGSSTLTINQSTNTHFSGIIEDGGANRLVALVKSNVGTLNLTSPNTYTGSTTISGGELALGASNVLSNTTAVSIGNATLAVGAGFAETAGPLGVTSTATLHLGSGSTVGFANSNGTWAGTLNITGTFVPGSSIRFGTSSTGLNSSQLTKISASGFGPFVLDGSGYLTIDNTIPTLAASAIVDNISGGPVDIGTLVTYTITFSEDIAESTVSAADFNNAGSATITFGMITETSPGAFTLQVTPTSPGTLQLRLPTSATITDFAGNMLITIPAISDNTTLSVRTPYQAWLAVNGRAGTAADLNEYAFGTTHSGAIIVHSPTSITLGQAPAMQITGSTITAIYGRLQNYQVSGLTYKARFSVDLNTWYDSTDTANLIYAGTPDLNSPTVVATHAGMNAVSIPFPTFIKTANGYEKTNAFMTIKVTAP